MFKALRTIPVIFDIIRDMEEICPNAWLINFTNPVGIVSEAAALCGPVQLPHFHALWHRALDGRRPGARTHGALGAQPSFLRDGRVH